MADNGSTSARPTVTVASFASMKADGTPIVVSTAYDYPSAALVEQAGVDAILVGDSLAMTVLGFDSTLRATMDDMVRHTAAVSRAAKSALVIADMPFMSWHVSVEEGIRNGGRLLSEGGARAVKLEGATADTLVVVDSLVEAGVPVMGHLGLTPQSVNVFGGYRVQGVTAEAAARIIDDALLLEEAGAFAIVLECVPAELAERISVLLDIPTIGIGAGAGCDGQVQVFHDLIGYGVSDRVPRHARRFADASSLIRDAVAEYVAEVRAKTFPTDAQSTPMDPETLAEAELLYAQACPDAEPCEGES